MDFKDAELSRFIEYVTGGKNSMWQGMADPLIAAHDDHINAYVEVQNREAVEKELRSLLAELDVVYALIDPQDMVRAKWLRLAVSTVVDRVNRRLFMYATNQQGKE